MRRPSGASALSSGTAGSSSATVSPIHGRAPRCAVNSTHSPRNGCQRSSQVTNAMASMVTVRSSQSFADTVTVMVPGPVGRTTARARPLNVSWVGTPNVSSVHGLPLPKPWSTAGPSTRPSPPGPRCCARCRRRRRARWRRTRGRGRWRRSVPGPPARRAAPGHSPRPASTDRSPTRRGRPPRSAPRACTSCRSSRRYGCESPTAARPADVAVDQQLHLVGVGVHLDRDRLPFGPGPRPRRDRVGERPHLSQVRRLTVVCGWAHREVRRVTKAPHDLPPVRHRTGGTR